MSGMSDMAKEAIKEIREMCWGFDIPSPCCPEYKEHHEQMQTILKLCDKWLKKLEEEKEAKKCPKCGSDLYEYCFMCCYEGEKVTKNGGEDIPKSPSQECMKRGEQVREWIMQGMKEADEWIKENGKNPYADFLLEKEGEQNE